MSTSMFEGFIIVTNRRLCEGDFLTKIDALAQTEARAIILREKDLGEVQYRALAEKVLAVCRAHGKPCLLHSHLKMAEEMGADGVHLPLPLLLQAAGRTTIDKKMALHVTPMSFAHNGAVLNHVEPSHLCKSGAAAPGPLPCPFPRGRAKYALQPSFLDKEARRRRDEIGLPAGKYSNCSSLGTGASATVEGCCRGANPFIIGASVHSVEEARLAENAGASYLLAGHIFETDCKRGLPGRGLGFLEEVSRSVKIPVYGLGGLAPEHLPALRARGAAGGALMSLAMRG